MGYDARIESLRSKHADLEAAVVSEARRPLPDEEHLLDLKRKKLRIKDEIQRISN